MPADIVRVADFTPTRVQPPEEPDQVERTIRVTKKVQFSQVLAGGSSADFSPAEIAAAVPGGLTYWNTLRVERINVWAGAQQDNTMTVQVPSLGGNNPPLTLTDSGTGGARRPAVGFRLGLLERSRFYGVADTTTLVTVSASVPTTVVIQATVELASPP